MRKEEKTIKKAKHKLPAAGWELIDAYLGARGWDDPLQLQRLCFHPSTPRTDPRPSPPFLLLLLSSVFSPLPPFYKDKPFYPTC